MCKYIIEYHQRGGQRIIKPVQGTEEDARTEAQALVVDPSVTSAYIYKKLAGYQAKVIAEPIPVPEE